MKIEIVATNDENFILTSQNSKEVQSEQIVQEVPVQDEYDEPHPLDCPCDKCMPPQPPSPPAGPRAAPLYNHTETNSFNLFSGTSWG